VSEFWEVGQRYQLKKCTKPNCKNRVEDNHKQCAKCRDNGRRTKAQARGGAQHRIPTRSAEEARAALEFRYTQGWRT